MLENQAQALKPIVKDILHELLLQERETLTDVIYEVIEDIALAKAIEEGLDDENVSREEIFWVTSSKFMTTKIRDVIKLLEKDGWFLVNTVGSHRQYEHPTKR